MNSRERNEKRLQEVRRKKIFLVAAGVGTIILILSGISFWGTRKPKIDVKSGIQEIKKLEKKIRQR